MKDPERMTNDELKRNLRDCRNELCYQCGRSRERHLGACDDCRWRHEYEETNDA